MDRATIDGNEAAASVAYRLNEVCCIFPITPSSPMAELADEWSSKGRANLWGTVPAVVEMQSEGGAAGALHGALQGGALGTTFTASQGLLLMIPNMYKIAGELTSAVISDDLVRAHRARALSPERPFIRGTAQNPDIYFQARETVNPFYARLPDVVQSAMDRLGERTGRRYNLVDYSGHPEAERVVVV